MDRLSADQLEAAPLQEAAATKHLSIVNHQQQLSHVMIFAVADVAVLVCWVSHLVE
jgi:hypothetical protein